MYLSLRMHSVHFGHNSYVTCVFDGGSYLLYNLHCLHAFYCYYYYYYLVLVVLRVMSARINPVRHSFQLQFSFSVSYKFYLWNSMDD